MHRKSFVIGLALSCVIILGSGKADAKKIPSDCPNADLLVTGLEGATGSTIGPDGALYVTEGAAGRISRVDPQTGEITTFASGLPPSIVGIGGAIDVAFIHKTAYVLVTLVGPDFGGSDRDVVGIYRVDGPHSFTVVANIGKFNVDNPPSTPFDAPTGLQYALQTYRGGFLVTDGHLNRVLRVTLDGEVSVLIAFPTSCQPGWRYRATRCTWPRPVPSPTYPRTARLYRSGRGHPPPWMWPPVLASSSTWNLAAVTVSTRSHRGTIRATLRVLRRCRTLARSSRSTGTAPSPSSRTVWTSRPRSSSSGTLRTSSPSPERSGRSRASRVRPTVGRVEQPGGLTPVRFAARQ